MCGDLCKFGKYVILHNMHFLLLLRFEAFTALSKDYCFLECD
jgi:hypothetical protein